MSIIIDPAKTLVSIEILYLEEEKRHGNTVFSFIRSKEELDQYVSDGYSPDSTDPSKKIKSLKTIWKRLNWKEHNSIIAKSMLQAVSPTGQASSRLDPIIYRDQKLKTCLKKWDLKDDEGKDVELNDMIVDNLAPDVAQELLDAFERVTEMTSADLKK
jgi:hypothetical protein